MKRRILLFALPILFIGLVGFKIVNDKYFEISKNIEIFSNLYKEINTHYVDELDPGSLMKIGVMPCYKHWTHIQIIIPKHRWKAFDIFQKGNLMR